MLKSLYIQLTSTDYDLDEISTFAIQLRDEIDSLDNVKEAKILKLDNYQGDSKSGEILDYQSLLITFVASGGISTLLTLLNNWLQQRRGLSVMLEIDGKKLEVTGINSDEQRELIELWKSKISEEAD